MIKKLLFIATIILTPVFAFAQQVISTGGGGGGTPSGSSGQIQYNNAGAFGGFTISGDSTENTSTGVMTNTGINGTPVTTSLASGTDTVTSTSANALAVGPNGATNPTFSVNSNTASAVSGVSVIGGATGVGAQIVESSSDTSGVGLNLTILGKASTAAGAGGAVNITGGASSVSGLGGAVNITSGASTSASSSGAITIKSGVPASGTPPGTVTLGGYLG